MFPAFRNSCILLSLVAEKSSCAMMFCNYQFLDRFPGKINKFNVGVVFVCFQAVINFYQFQQRETRRERKSILLLHLSTQITNKKILR